MPHYMFQCRYTSPAIKAMVENPQDREAPARVLVEKAGGKLHSLFFCFGSEDVVAIIEAPNDKAMAASALVLGASGAFSGGATTKLLTPGEAKEAMEAAKSLAASYRPATA